MTNFYNTVKVETTGEPKISLTDTLDSWGTKLIQPRQAAYEGRTYTIDPLKKEISKELSSESTSNLTLLDKVKVNIGLIFKKVAAFFNKAIEAKYRLITAEEGIDTKPLWDALQPTKRVSLAKQGDDFDCCTCKCLDCEPAGSRRRYYR